MVQKVVVCMCGLPASGKTTIANILGRHLKLRGVDTSVIAFDDILEDRLSEGHEFSSEVWKNARSESFAQVQRALCGRCVCGEEGKHECSRVDVILVDDNMYLSSMRREVYVLAREDVEQRKLVCCSCMYRQFQKLRILETMQDHTEESIRWYCPWFVGCLFGYSVIDRMDAMFEPPGSKPFEKNCFVVINDNPRFNDLEVETGQRDIEEVIQRILSLQPMESMETQLSRDMERKQADTHESMQHALDLTLRKWVARVMVQTTAADTEMNIHQRQIAIALSQAKKQTLAASRTMIEQENSTTTITTITTTASDIFVQQVRDILTRAVAADVADAVGQVLTTMLSGLTNPEPTDYT